jgi:hypothetical protein
VPTKTTTTKKNTTTKRRELDTGGRPCREGQGRNGHRPRWNDHRLRAWMPVR